jgi:hypothetical protein
MRNRSTRNLKNNLKKKEKKPLILVTNGNCFHMWVLHVGIESSTIISNCHSKQYVHVAHRIDVSFGNSKPLQT